MAKVFNYIFLVLGIIIVFNIAGMQTLTGTVLGQLKIIELGADASQFAATTFFTNIAWALGILAGIIAITIGVLGRGDPRTFVTASIGTFVLGAFVGEILTIAKLVSMGVNSWISYVVLAICIPLAFAFAFAIYEWVLGQD